MMCNHASLIRFHYPHLRIVESDSMENSRPRRDVRWITDIGELHEYYLDGWKQQHFICDSWDAWDLGNAGKPRSRSIFEKTRQAQGTVTCAHLPLLLYSRQSV